MSVYWHPYARYTPLLEVNQTDRVVFAIQDNGTRDRIERISHPIYSEAWKLTLKACDRLNNTAQADWEAQREANLRAVCLAARANNGHS